jgi:NAD(P)-dependent dehydrogenase (short-subunit alcohol dehydrogenase family)
MLTLEGRRALVTGGGTGIGFGCAEALVAAGAQVAIAARREDVLIDAAQRLGHGVRHVVCDITDEAQVEHAVGVAAGGRALDILVANAGSGAPGAILQMSAAEWEFCFRINVVGTALCNKHAGLLMRETGGGSITTISSTSGTKVQPWLAAYVVSKAGLDMLVRSAAVELSPHGIRVNSIQAGYVRSEVMTASAEGPLDETLQRATPLGRAGSPADIGQAVAFLASDAASWITGQAFGVDGGLNIPVMPSMAPIAARLYGEDTVRSFALPDFTALNAPEDVL